jgi:uncharacterized MAPEG superfamily protein
VIVDIYLYERDGWQAAAYTAETEEVRSRTLEAGAAAAAAYRALLAAVLAAVSTGDKHQFPELSRRVAHAVADIIAVAEQLKGLYLLRKSVVTHLLSYFLFFKVTL